MEVIILVAVYKIWAVLQEESPCWCFL